jgi:glycosyltransferase involved in cell wall biosynthesis
MAALEAIACGCPAVVPDVGGFGDVVADGAGGFRYPPGDVPAAAERVMDLLDDADRRARVADAGRARALQQFSPRAAIEQLLDALRRLPEPEEAGLGQRDCAAAVAGPGGRR